MILITALLAVMGILYIGEKMGARKGDAPLVCDLAKELSGKSENEDLSSTILFNGQTLTADYRSNTLFYSLNKNDAASFSPKALVLDDADAYVVMDREITSEMIEKACRRKGRRVQRIRTCRNDASHHEDRLLRRHRRIRMRHEHVFVRQRCKDR